ncbi:hypothetical protein TWF694_006571 [Orbilia ellipsospora]|uniref:Uncharacterized protein n=1 Tax=Orbilia ellipsospora TaxID=2528407 RepID=A0AAV9XS93_9PEZI
MTIRCEPAREAGMGCEELKYGVESSLAGIEWDCKVCYPYDIDFNPPPPPQNRSVVYRAIALTPAVNSDSVSSSTGSPTPTSSESRQSTPSTQSSNRSATISSSNSRQSTSTAQGSHGLLVPRTAVQFRHQEEQDSAHLLPPQAQARDLALGHPRQSKGYSK